MKKLSRILITVLAAVTVFSSGAIGASAAQVSEPVAAPAAVVPGDEPQADSIITIWRTNEDGVRQYRRWNDTKHYWVDPYWITP